MAKLKFGLIVDNANLPLMLAEMVRTASTSDLYSIDCLIVQQPPVPVAASKTFLQKAALLLQPRELESKLRFRLFKFIVGLERFMLLRRPETSIYLQTTPIVDTGLPSITVTPEISDSGYVYRYTEDDLRNIADLGLDGLIRGGSGILKGDILSLCRFGVLSFHHGDNDQFRGGPAGFWEVYRREKSTGFIIQKLGDEIDGGDVFVKGSIGTQQTYLQNQIKLYRKSGKFMHLLLEKIARHGKLPDARTPVPYANPLFRFKPGLDVQAIYLWRYIWMYFMMQVDAVLGRGWRWGVSYQFVDNWQSAVLWRSTEIENPKNHFIADPFVIARNGKHYIYVEDYDYATSKGVITVYAVDQHGYRDLGLVLEEDFHLSYPYLLDHNDELYMIPESEQKREIRMYRCTDFPLKWELHRVLMSDIAATDSTVFEHNGKWWMFTNVDSANVEDHDSELHIFYADAPDSTEWTPHARNPVIFDSLFARMGGFLTDDDGQKYRVYQKQGFAVYGEAMGIAKIEQLDENDYRESIFVEIEPTFYKDIRGTHTYAYDQGLLAIDHLRWSRLHD